VDYGTKNMNENSERCSLLDISGKKQTVLTVYLRRPAKRTLPKDAQSDRFDGPRPCLSEAASCLSEWWITRTSDDSVRDLYRLALNMAT
jgi:hypothetical protein